MPDIDHSRLQEHSAAIEQVLALSVLQGLAPEALTALQAQAEELRHRIADESAFR